MSSSFAAGHEEPIATVLSRSSPRCRAAHRHGAEPPIATARHGAEPPMATARHGAEPPIAAAGTSSAAAG